MALDYGALRRVTMILLWRRMPPIRICAYHIDWRNSAARGGLALGTNGYLLAYPFHPMAMLCGPRTASTRGIRFGD